MENKYIKYKNKYLKYKKMIGGNYHNKYIFPKNMPNLMRSLIIININ
jgi:hypothetical protein